MLKYSSRQTILFFVALAISAFTHLWNPTGFPSPNVDEGIYLGRAIRFIDNFSLKDPYIGYDHPYFGQIFLAAYLFATGYESFLDSNSYLNSAILLAYPRVLMGALSMLDTFLIFKIVELRYGGNAALLAAFLFAVMPVTWMTRWILLDSIQLPFILLSMLLAIKSSMLDRNQRSRTVIIFVSGVSLGLAIFTKIPAFTMIPLISYLILRPNESRLVSIVIWVIPTILIPSLWAIHAISADEFDKWWDGVNHQLHRESRGISLALYDLFNLDALMLLIGVSSLIYCVIKRDSFVFLAIVPNLIFFSFIGYVVVFHLLLLAILFCIPTSRFLIDAIQFVSKKKIPYKVSIIGLGAILCTGLFVTVTHVASDANSSYFRAAAYIGNYLESNSKNDNQSVEDNKGIGIIGHPYFYWTEKYKVHNNNGYWINENKFENNIIMPVIDNIFREAISQNDQTGKVYTKLFSSFNVKKIFSIKGSSANEEPIEAFLLNLTRYKKDKINVTDLLDEQFTWTNRKYSSTQRGNGEMNVTLNTVHAKNKENVVRVFSNNTVNLDGKVAFLYLVYYNPLKTDATFTIELKNAHSNDRIWSQQLTNQHKQKVLFFILPENIAANKINADIRIHSLERSVDSLILRNFSLYN